MTTQTLPTNSAILDNVAASSISFDVLESRQYHAALALNNIGVALLDKNSFRDALVTLKNALELIKGVAFMKRNQVMSLSSDELVINRQIDAQSGEAVKRKKTSKDVVPSNDINSYLHSANDMLRRSQKSRNKNRRSKLGLRSSFAESNFVPSSSPTVFDLTILSDHDNDSMYDAAHTYPMHNSGYAVHIDTTCDYYTSHLPLETAIIMMNYSIAFRCAAATKSTSPSAESTSVTREQLLQNALKLADVSFQLLTLDAAKYSESAFLNDDDGNSSTRSNVLSDSLLQERIELILLIVIQGLMHISFDLGSNDDGRRFYAMLGDLHITAQKKRTVNDRTSSPDSVSVGVCLKSVAPAA
jgi:hypothetical protein